MITSIHNPQIKDVRKLQRRRQRYRKRAFLLEGVRLVRDAYRSDASIRQLFYAPQLIETNEHALSLLATCEKAGIHALACTPDVFATLTETLTPQGIAAVVEMPRLALPSTPTLTLVLDQVRDPGNAGTLMRTAEAAGVDVVIFGPETVDLYNAKVVRAAMGAHFRLPTRNCATWKEVHAMLFPGQLCYVAKADAPLPYDQVDWCQSSLLIVGGEADGASPETVEFAQAIAIPMNNKVESLNAAVAGAIILFEAARQRRG